MYLGIRGKGRKAFFRWMFCKIRKENNRKPDNFKKEFVQICHGITQFASYNSVFQSKHDSKMSFALMIW